ncbi:hypothetical protein DIURU_002037 [Diutina rugosa]|uniref:Nucleoporin Nup159/Nup146 N-terminal domain-containing protein n=1 Tax=Diutina rugosa TaxID=5481 RepID=A0A642URF3_DIURU|nr:uncharacterized protein DIURU_002037 [Diutina rugosa]KAA8904085.1 hypothetical protein DIURU_002037 [Diutina rugosa]
MIAESYRDDFRFKAITNAEGEFGVVAFDHTLNPDADSTAAVRLLAITRDGKTMAASDGAVIKIGPSDQVPSSWKSYTIPKVKKITQLAFTPNGDELYILHNETLSKVKLSELASEPTAVKVANATDFQVAPNGDVGYLDSGSAYLKRGNEPPKEIAEDVFCVCFDQESKFCYISMANATAVMSTDGKKVSFDCESVTDLYPCALIALRPNVYFIAAQDDEDNDPVNVVADPSKIETDVEFLGPYGPVKWAPSYFSQSLDKYNPKKKFTLVSGTRTTDIYVIESTGDSVASLQWPIPSDDSCRASFPTTEDFEDTAVLGIAVDVSQSTRVVDDPWPGAEEDVKGAPIVHALLDDGRLISWWIVDKQAILEDGASLLNESVSSISSKASLSNNSQTTSENSINDESPATNTQPNPFAKSSASDNPFANNASNPFGKSSGGSFGGSFGGSSQKSENVFGSTGAFGSIADKKAESSNNEPKGASEDTGSTIGSQSQNDKAKASGGAFGSVGFGGKTSTTSSTSGGSAFGSSGFGNSGFGSSGFGQSKSGNSSASSAFGSSGFGQKSSSETKSAFSGFGGFATKDKPSSSSFASHARSQSPFANLSKTASSSPFGAVNSESKASPFGTMNAKGKSSSFGSLGGDASKSSPFGAVNSQKESKPSPFGAVKSDDTTHTSFGSSKTESEPSLFGKTSPSPFEGLQNKSKSSTPFGGTQEKTSSPLETSENGKDSPNSLFASLNISKDTQAFGASKSDTSTHSPSGDSSTTSPFMKNHNSNAAFGTKNETSHVEHGLFGQRESSSLPEKTEKSTDSGLQSESKDEANPTSQHNEKSSPFTSNNSQKPKSNLFEHIPISSALPDSIEEPETVPPSRAETVTPINNVDNFEGSSFVDRTEGESTSSSEFESEPEEELEQEYEQESEFEPELIDYREVFIARESPQIPIFNYFDGFTAPLAGGASRSEMDAKVAQQYREIIGFTKGHLKVSKDNAEKLAPLFAYHSPMTEYCPGEDDLEHTSAWALGNAPQLREIAVNRQQSVDDVLSELQLSESKVKRVLSQLEDTHLVRGQIDTMLKQLKHLLDQQEISKHRQLDFANEALRKKLQAKYDNVCQLESVVLEKLVPLKARTSGSEAEVVKRLYDLVYSLRAQIKQHAESILKLRQEVKDAQLENLKKSATDLIAAEAPPTIIGSSMKSRVQVAKVLRK